MYKLSLFFKISMYKRVDLQLRVFSAVVRAFNGCFPLLDGFICYGDCLLYKFDAEIKSYRDGKTIGIYHNHYLPFTYNSKCCRYVCNCYYYDRAVHISVDMRTLLDRKNFSSRTNGQGAARRVTGLIIKRLCLDYDHRSVLWCCACRSSIIEVSEIYTRLLYYIKVCDLYTALISFS